MRLPIAGVATHIHNSCWFPKFRGTVSHVGLASSCVHKEVDALVHMKGLTKGTFSSRHS